MSNRNFTTETEALNKVETGLSSLAKTIVPWFYKNLHEYYFKTHSQEEQIRHLMAIISGYVRTDNHSVVLRSPCGTKVTYITPGTDLKSLIGVLEQLKGSKIKTARIYASKDGSLRLDSFELALNIPPSEKLVVLPEEKFISELVEDRLLNPEEKTEFSSFLSCATADYLNRIEKGRAVRHFRINQQIKRTEQVLVQVESEIYPGEDRITIAMKNPPQKALLLEVVKVLSRFGVKINRLYADLFESQDMDSSVIISAYVSCLADKTEGGEACCSYRFVTELQHIKWYTADRFEWFADHQDWSLAQVSLLQASAEFAHQYLLKKDPYRYTQDFIASTMIKNPDVCDELFRFFKARFDPQEEDREDILPIRESNVLRAVDNISDESQRNVFTSIFFFFKHTLKTNYFLPKRFGLSFRLEPELFSDYPEGELPFGLFFFHGPKFLGFHVRYRDMARGGVRVVRTRNEEHFKLESQRLFSEVTALALAQQYKNKDIPEGGSKAVLLLRPGGEVDMAVKSMADSLLDLIVSSAEQAVLNDVVDYFKKHEIIYLGPDENITSKHIEWIVRRAKERGYKWPEALMSSKPKAGINHKQYGVTSLGVIVFLEEALKAIGINPYQDSFSLKITGGPAGDVAGNAMKLLANKYGERAKILAVSDGHGAAYDPLGLDHQELLRLVKEGLSIDHFGEEKLQDPSGFVLEAKTPESTKKRDELHNVVVADVFLPCGGRPDTVNVDNWQKFIQANGEPSAKVIVEGANIFISPPARDKLQERGIMIFHGSSANKAGVISSSYEILAGLILQDTEFLEIKEEYVQQLLKILEKRARDEARLLLREYRFKGGESFLTELTMKVSKEINQLGDLICETLIKNVADLSKDELLCAQLEQYCPQILVKRYQERIVNDIPVRHRFALLGAYIASRIVYREGLGWLSSLAKVRDIFEVIRSYLEQEEIIKDYLKELLRQKELPVSELVRIIRATGQKYLTVKKLGLD